jgi:teichuronic acid exporter
VDLKGRATSAAKWSLIEKFLKRIVTFVLSIFLARLLEPSDFGLIAMCSVFLSLADSLSDMGMGQAIVQRKELSDKQYNSIFFLNLGVGVFIILVIWITAPLISRFYNYEELTMVLRISSLTYLINSFVVINNAIIYKSLKIKVLTTAMLYSSILSGILGISLAYMGFGVWSLVAQSIFSSLVNAIVISFYSKWRFAFEFDFSSIKEIWKAGLSFMNIGVINEFVDRLDHLVIGKYFSAADLGLMNRAKALQELPQYTFILPVTRPLFPVFASIQNDIDRVKDVFSKTIDLLSFVMILLFGFIYLSAENIILVLYTDKWIESVPYLRIMVWLLPILPIGFVITSLLKGLGRLRLLTIVTVIERGMIVLALFICLYYGLITYLYALVLLKSLALLFKLTLLNKYVGFDVWDILKSFIITLVISLISIRVAMFVELSNPYLDIFTKSILYVGMVLGISVALKVKGYLIAKSELLSYIQKKK